MIGRISTWIFYAVVFFLLGAWSNAHWGGLGNFIDRSLDASRNGAAAAWEWAQGTGVPEQAAKADPEPAAPKIEAQPAVDGPAAAREAFARGDFNGAVAAYKAFLESHPSDADARGELGNVYFNAGRLDEAAAAYFEAATLLLAAGAKDRAQALEAPIRLGNPQLADELARKIAQS